MARFNEILVGRFNRALQKYTAIKGGPPAAQLATEIGSQFQFNQMGMDFRALEGWNTFWAFLSQGPTAGQTNTFQFRNPAGSNIVVVMESFSITDNVAAQLLTLSQIRTPQAELTNTGVAKTRDTRTGFIGGGSLFIFFFMYIVAFAICTHALVVLLNSL